MLVATPGQAASYSTLHNNSTNGGGTNNTSAAPSTTKKPSTSSATSGTAKPLNTNNSQATSIVTTKSSLNSKINSTTNNCHPNFFNKISNQTKGTATSSREIVLSTKQTATIHSLKPENSTNTTSTTNTKHHSFIQTLKDSVQKALISTTGSNSNSNCVANKNPTDNKLQNNCKNSTTSISNVTSSSSSTCHNANKVSTTTSSNTSSNSTTATQSSSTSVVRGKFLSCSLSKLHTVAPTIIHRYPEERQHTSSTDSLQKEMCHFKPIRIVPKTPWKSGSKSRGNSLRFPKANLATKKTEFVLKSNCDANNRKKKLLQNRTQIDKLSVTEDDDDNGQENKEFHGIYKPKPSLTCLSTSFTTPNHQSAFVCLVSQMKNLVNLQPKKELTSTVEDMPEDLAKVRYTRKKQKPEKSQQLEDDIITELPKPRGTRLSLYVKNKGVSNQTAATKEVANAKSNNISQVSKVAITKAKSRRKLAAPNAKEKLKYSASMPVVIDNKTKTVALTSKNTRKRKATRGDDNDTDKKEQISTFRTSPLPTKSVSNISLLLSARKSSRLSSRGVNNPPANNQNKYYKGQNSIQATIKPSKKSNKTLATVASFSPPMTRSRLKHLAEQGKIVTTASADIKKRKI